MSKIRKWSWLHRSVIHKMESPIFFFFPCSNKQPTSSVSLCLKRTFWPPKVQTCCRGKTRTLTLHCSSLSAGLSLLSCFLAECNLQLSCTAHRDATAERGGAVVLVTIWQDTQAEPEDRDRPDSSQRAHYLARPRGNFPRWSFSPWSTCNPRTTAGRGQTTREKKAGQSPPDDPDATKHQTRAAGNLLALAS